MQKIMFNDRYGLTQAVIEGRKTMTRRLMKPSPEDCSGFHKVMPAMCDWKDEPMSLIFDAHNNAAYCQYCGYGIDAFAKFKFKPKYKVGEIVAVAQCYKYAVIDETETVPYRKFLTIAREHKGWNNKMYVSAEMMPHRIRITNIRCERLQEISDEDCIREGIFVNEYVGNGKKCFHYGYDGFLNGREGWFAKGWYDTPREAFAALIDKVSGCGTWERNPWVVVYEFELVK